MLKCIGSSIDAGMPLSVDPWAVNPFPSGNQSYNKQLAVINLQRILRKV
jgi:hypothetical protein